MKHTSIFLFLLLAFYGMSYGQLELNTPLPMDPAVRTGTLPNGMKYYVRQNSKPEKRAEFRLAVNAGSTSENDDQQGLAHLLEHMAFNGTKKFKKNELIDYLESVGTKFGAHLNAYTSFDETVYMIQLPTDKKEIVDKGLEILEEWAQNLAFDSLEIEKERGVVVEEWRIGQGADERMRRAYWPVIFKDSRYAVRLPIGKKEIIENCSQKVIRDFYYDWYRPDLMSIIAVGDFDPAQMEAQIKEQFSKIPAKKNARPLVSYDVPDNKDLLVATAKDKEARFSLVQLYYKQPKEVYTTVADYRRSIAQQLFSAMMSARMNELQRQADAPFMFSSSGFGRMVRPKYIYSSVAACKEDGIERALQTLAAENERVRRFGFVSSELKRQKEEMMSRMEKAFSEKDKTESRDFAREYVSHYLNAEPMPGIEFERAVYQKYLDGITLEEVNAFAQKWITDGQNCIAIITAPDKETTAMPGEEKIRSIIKGMRQLELKPYEDKVISKPLIAEELKGAKVTSTNRIEEYDITEWRLSNGVKVVVKPTDFKNDEILFTSYSWGGWSLYPEKDYWSAASSDEIVDESGVGDFDATALEKLLTGKILSLSPYVSELQQGFTGSCSPRDLETLLQLTYKYFTDPRTDKDAFQSYMERQKGVLQNKAADPQSTFMDTVSYVMSGYNYRNRPRTVEMLKEIDHERAIQIYKERFSDASGFTFFFVGNFKMDELKAMVEKYLGSLPALNKRERWQDIGAEYPKGKVERVVRKGVEPKSTVMMRFNTPFEYNRKNRNEVSALSKLLNIRLREVLREDKSGVYGVSCFSQSKHYPNENLETMIFFSCSPDNVDMLVSAALDVINEVKTTLCDEKNLTKIKETAIRERETNFKENQFWLNAISASAQNGEDIMELKGYNGWIQSLTTKDLKEFANKYLQTDNYAKFVLRPEK